MAARLNPKITQQHRDKIQTTQLLNRLSNFVLGKGDPKTKDPIEMSPAQVTACLGLLKKVLPDLQATEISGETTLTYVARIPVPAQNAEEWEQQHTPKHTTH